jgi:hypothetical protein
MTVYEAEAGIVGGSNDYTRMYNATTTSELLYGYNKRDKGQNNPPWSYHGNYRD